VKIEKKVDTTNPKLRAATTTSESKPVEAVDAKHDVFDRVAAPGAGSAGNIPALLEKLGLEQTTTAQPAKVKRRFAQNIRKLVGGLVEREKKFVKHAFEAMKSFGLATIKCTTRADFVQLHDFAKLAIENGRPLEVFSILTEVAQFLWKYPEEARHIMRFVANAQQDTWKQKSAWMAAATAGATSNVQLPPANAPRKKADVVVIGGGLSAGHILRNFVDQNAGKKITVLEKDSLAKREHAASLRNAGIVSTAYDYIFDLDEAFGEKPIDRIKKALDCSDAEAKVAYQSIHHVMGDATNVIRDFLRAKGVADDAIEMKPAGGIDMVHDADELETLRGYVKQARALGFDWEAIDAKVLDEKYHVKSPDVVGALEMKDSSILHPGKLVKALFDYATAKSKDVSTEFETEVLHAKPNEKGDGWILVTNKGEIEAKDVIDAREAYAPYRFREARFSQIHVIDVNGDQKGPMGLGSTNVCHSLTYMRKISDGKFLVGSGDFPVRDPHDTPPPMASVALYAAAHFKMLYPDTPYNIEKVWGGVFGLSTDGLPVSGSLLKGWHVVGGAGGSGMNITPATSKQVVDEILGHAQTGPLQSSASFSPRRFFLHELREELAKSLHQLSAMSDLPVEKVRVIIGNENRPPVIIAGEVMCVVDEKTLDAMNTDAAVLFGPRAQEEMQAREHAKAVWVRKQVDDIQRDVIDAAVSDLLGPAIESSTTTLATG
jgi:glycine/D-amino acid oxidase-like deaminating enzyme